MAKVGREVAILREADRLIAIGRIWHLFSVTVPYVTGSTNAHPR
jgi:hypothetical protein